QESLSRISSAIAKPSGTARSVLNPTPTIHVGGFEMKRIVWATCFAIAAAMPLAAAAEEAFTVQPVDVFAGPSSEFPPVAQLPPTYRVELFGCLGDWSWCDVGFAGDRGWIYAADLVIPYRGSRVTIIEYGPRIHLHIVSFSLIAYWDAHY